MEIDKVLGRLRETTGEINRATDDPRMKATMEKTWILQDRLLLNGQVREAYQAAKSFSLFQANFRQDRRSFEECYASIGARPYVRGVTLCLADSRRR